MTELPVLIIEDEFPARRLLEEYVGRAPGVRLAGSYANPLAALDQLKQGPVGLLLLDINTPELTGMELLKVLPKAARPPVILITAYAEYAVDAFAEGVVDYLVKPVPFPRFLQAIERVLSTSVMPQPAIGQDPLAEVLMVKTGGKTYRIAFSDIRYIQGLRENVLVCTADRQLIVNRKLRELAQELPANRFLRTHKSYIAGLAHVHFRESMELVLHDGFRIPIGQTYKAEVDTVF